MVTRDIKKNTATQVNANLIGVQVRPDVVPPTYEVSDLTANVRIDQVECTNKMNGLTMVCASGGSGDDIWAYTGTQEEYNGTVYNVWSCIMGDTTAPNMLTISTDTITDNTQFYMYLDDPNNPQVVSTFVSSYMLTYEGTLVRFDPNDYLYVTGSQDTYSSVDGFVLNKDIDQYVGKIVSDSLDNEEYGCAYLGEEGEYTKWRVDHIAEIYLFSTTRNPSVGDNLRSNMYGSEVYLSPVLTVTEEEVEPGYTEDVDCTLSYSVDGSTWTDWPDNMTDDNNVISNIPRYMYLKFSQDVVITEE